MAQFQWSRDCCLPRVIVMLEIDVSPWCVCRVWPIHALGRHLKAESPPHRRHAFPPRQCKNPRLSGGGSRLRKPDDYLLSHGYPHYHRRRVVSRSCSGWEGVGPTRYGHQAKRVVALLRNATNPGRSSNLGCVYHTRASNLSPGSCSVPSHRADLQGRLVIGSSLTGN